MAAYSFLQVPQQVPFVKTKYRCIKTKIPVPESISIFNELEKFEARSMHGQLPVVWDKAEGFSIFDKYGNRWIDFTSTIFVTNSGHANPFIISALQKQLNKKLLHTYTFPHEIRLKFLKRLIEVTPKQLEKAFLLSSGTEATECAIKLIRMYGQLQQPSKLVVISFKGAMHGRTMGAEMLKGDPNTSSWIGYRDPHIYHLPFPFPPLKKKKEINWAEKFYADMADLKKKGLNFKQISGFIIESYLGWAALFFPKDYLRALEDFARRNNILIAFDEIQAGFGRTGKMFAFEHYGVEPDLICLGKALSGGLPLSAVVGRKHILDLPDTGSMSSTHSANPLACAAGLANLEFIISHNLVKDSVRKGKLLQDCLFKLKEEFPERIAHIFGKGLVAAIIFKKCNSEEPDSLFPSRVCERAMQKGLLLVYTGRESIKIGPPLVISNEALREGLRALKEAIIEIHEEIQNENN